MKKITKINHGAIFLKYYNIYSSVAIITFYVNGQLKTRAYKIG